MRFGAFLIFARCGRSWSIPSSRTGALAPAGSSAAARSTSPAESPSRWPPVSRPLPRRWSWARARTTGARRSCRTTPSTSSSGAGLLWFGWFGFNGGSGFNTGQNSTLAFTNTLLTPGVRADHLVRARPHPRANGDRDRRRYGDHRRLRPHHSGGRLYRPRLGDGTRFRGSVALLRADRVPAAHPRGRDARRPRRARSRRLHGNPVHRVLRLGELERDLGRRLLRQLRPARRSGPGRGRGARCTRSS